jgi:hypothetical protein
MFFIRPGCKCLAHARHRRDDRRAAEEQPAVTLKWNSDEPRLVSR